MDQPSVIINGFTLCEPATVLTDLLLSAACIGFARYSSKIRAGMWPLFFYCMSAAMFLGALGHGLYIDKNNTIQLIARIFGVLSVFMAGKASLQLLEEGGLRSTLTRLNSVLMYTCIITLLYSNHFWVSKLNGILGMGALVGGIHAKRLFSKQEGSELMVGGLLVNALAGVIHSSELTLNKWFNHNDISHVIMLIGLYLIYKGVFSVYSNESSQVI